MTNDNAVWPCQSPFELFRVGDSVAHLSLGNGVVTSNDGQTITVAYTGTDQDTQGIYNEAYFKSNPHCPTSAPVRQI